MNSDDQKLAKKIFEEFIDAFVRGDNPSFDDYVDKYPNLKSILQKKFYIWDKLQNGLKSLSGISFSRGQEGTTLDFSDFSDKNITILDKIGSGGMGDIYIGREIFPNRLVAIKTLRISSNPLATLDRLKREAQTLARLQHHSIPPIYRVETISAGGFIVMPLILGLSLNEILLKISSSGKKDITGLQIYLWMHEKSKAVFAKVKDKLSEDEKRWFEVSLTTPSPFWSKLSYRHLCCYFISETARTLEFCHVNQILHLDIKPSNIILGLDGSVYLIDFGLGRRLGEESKELYGAPYYVAPEQVHHREKLSSSTDIYSLGATLYHLITLKTPFESDNPLKILAQVTDDKPLRPRKIDHTIPKDLEAIILKSVEKEPRHRYSSMHELSLDISSFLEYKPIIARPVNPMARFGKLMRRHPLKVSVIAIFMILLAIVFNLYQKHIDDKAENAKRIQQVNEYIDKNDGVINDFYILTENNLLVFNESRGGFDILHNKLYQKVEKQLKIKSKFISYYDSNTFGKFEDLLGAFDELGRREQKGEFDLSVIYEDYDDYIETFWGNKAVQEYVGFLRHEKNGAYDFFDKLEYLNNECKWYGENKEKTWLGILMCVRYWEHLLKD